MINWWAVCCSLNRRRTFCAYRVYSGWGHADDLARLKRLDRSLDYAQDRLDRQTQFLNQF